MRILFVGMPDSVHTARWVTQISERGWQILLFPVYGADLHPSFSHISYLSPKIIGAAGGNKIRYVRWPSFFFYSDILRRRLYHLETSNVFREQALIWAIRFYKPDIIHSLEFQHAGYLTLAARKRVNKDFPVWVATNWGSDIYLFGRIPEHRSKIREILETCDFYSCECERDVHLAQEMGLRGEVLPIIPNAGGFDLAHVQALRQSGPASKRRVILVKGYQHWAGRALVALRALARCAELLREGAYRVAIYSVTHDVQIAAQLFRQDHGVPVDIIPHCSHDEMLRQYGKARIYIGLSISDAISTSLLEAMVMGAFPIQSCTACADEWIQDGQSGLIVPPEDPDVVEAAIRKALNDNTLVDRAAEINWQVAVERLDIAVIAPKVTAFYDRIVQRLHHRERS